MRRREFISLATLAGLASASRAAGAGAPAPARPGAPANPATAPAGRGTDALLADDYFLHSGDLTAAEQREIAAFEEYQEQAARGGDVPAPRGRPTRAPTYRFVHWTGEPGGTDGTFVGPLSVKPALPSDGAVRFNAQIVGFQLATAEWGRRAPQGTLAVEIRGRSRGEGLTWLFAKAFDVFDGGATNLGAEHVAQRNNQPDPVLLEEPLLDLRIQLIRHIQKPTFLRSVLKVAAFVASPVVGSFVASAAPAVRIPQLVPEGVALAQAVLGSGSDERPLWASGFTTYALAAGAGRMKLVPGFWVAYDATLGDLRGVRLEELGDRFGLTRDGEPIDANYLVLAIDIVPVAAAPPADAVERGAPRLP